jgi:hypothetical protein
VRGQARSYADNDDLSFRRPSERPRKLVVSTEAGLAYDADRQPDQKFRLEIRK